jgi:hypothetical protein
MENTIAVCGLDCSQCEAYQATQADDLAWKQRVVDQWKNAYNVQVDIAGVTCDGCTSNSGRWGAHCANCDIRACGRARGLNNCAECPDYACEKLLGFFSFAPDARVNLDALQS